MDHLTKVVKAVGDQRMYLFRKFGKQLLRPYFEGLYRPMTREDIQVRHHFNFKVVLIHTSRKKSFT